MQPASRKACPAKCCPQRKRLIEQEKWMYLPPILTASPNSLECSWQCSFQISINLSNPRYQSQASLTRAVDHREERVASSQCEMTYREYTLPSERAAQRASLTSVSKQRNQRGWAHMKNISTEVSNWVIWQIEDIQLEVRNGLCDWTAALRLAQNGFEKRSAPPPPKENGSFPGTWMLFGRSMSHTKPETFPNALPTEFEKRSSRKSAQKYWTKALEKVQLINTDQLALKPSDNISVFIFQGT